MPHCPVCNSQAELVPIPGTLDFRFSCASCGTHACSTLEAETRLAHLTPGQRTQLSSILRAAQAQGQYVLLFDGNALRLLRSDRARASGNGAPSVVWKENDGTPATPPPDACEWLSIMREKVGEAFRAELTSDGRGHWSVSVAEHLGANRGRGPWNITPIDLRTEVRAALRAAGKPVAD